MRNYWQPRRPCRLISIRYNATRTPWPRSTATVACRDVPVSPYRMMIVTLRAVIPRVGNGA